MKIKKNKDKKQEEQDNQRLQGLPLSGTEWRFPWIGENFDTKL